MEKRTMNMKSSNMARFATGIGLVIASSFASATVIFSDGTFATTDWQESTAYVGSGTLTSNSVQSTFLGNPAPARMQIVSADNGQVDLLATHHYIPTALDPSSMTVNTVRISASLFANTPGEYSFLIRQAGQVFLSGWGSAASGIVTTQTTGILQSGDFELLTGINGAVDPFFHPDFSTTGSPMQFGVAFKESIDGSNGPTNRAYLIDNFVAEVNPVPEPATLVGLGMIGLAAMKAKRRKSV